MSPTRNSFPHLDIEEATSPLVDEHSHALQSATSLLNTSLSRRRMMGAGLVAGAALLLSGRRPARALGGGESTNLRFLEEVARMQADFFTRVSFSPTVEGMTQREINTFSQLARQDSEQARWFKLARGRYGVRAFDSFYSLNQSSSRPPTFYRFSAQDLSTRAGLYKLAIRLKETAVGAFHGVVGEGGSPELTQAIAALAGVQNRHLAMLSEDAERAPFVAFVPALSQQEVVNRLTRHGFNTEVLG